MDDRLLARLLSAAGAATLCLLGAGAARGSGVDIPALYGARYGGMGGAALAQVDEPSAVLHNPAGLAGVRSLALSGAVTLALTNLQTNPDMEDQSLQTGNSLAPGFLLAAGYRVHERVTVGFGFYPVGAVGGEFRYDNIAGVDTLNQQLALLVEASPGLAVELPGGVTLGAAYRASFLYFQRQLGPAADPATVDVEMTGTNLSGFRLGLQWAPVPFLTVGAAYRHRIVIEGTADEGRLLLQRLEDVRGELTVPSKLGVGVQGRLGPVIAAADVEYVFNDQFRDIPLGGTLAEDDQRIDVEFLFHWEDSITAKGGLEVALDDTLSARAGYAWDQPAANARYPSTFSAPPAASHLLTLGAGHDAGGWAVNVAVAHRFENSRHIAEDEIAPSSECRFCAHGGVYSARSSMLYVDLTVELD